MSDLRTKLNLETARLAWPELQRHFARGVVIVVESSQDLVDVAVAFAEDRRDDVERRVAQGAIHRASTDDAKHWQENDAVFWAVVVAPWVLVQEITGP